MAELLLTQVPDVPGVTLVVAPTQTEVAPPITGIAGIELMTIFVEAGEVQLFTLVTVNV
jgi:hypothetical protein